MSLNFYDLERHDLENVCNDIGASPQHARTLMYAAYRIFDPAPWSLPGLPKKLNNEGVDIFGAPQLTFERAEQSGYDYSVKFLARLADGGAVETVLMPERSRLTLCVSSQVGCAQACSFCHTGRMGLKRNLTAGEIVGQVMAANHWLRANPAWLQAAKLPLKSKVTNVVFMGMGEPLDNVEAVIKALRIMTDPHGLAMARRRLSVSTSGHLDGIKVLLRDMPQVSLALSLHATDDALRSRIMPINRRWPLGELIGFLRQHPWGKSSILIQYTLIRGINDDLKHARALVELLEGLPVKINLIPFNAFGVSAFQNPDAEVVEAFRDELHQLGMRVMIRFSKGQDIAAACGQLVV